MKKILLFYCIMQYAQTAFCQNKLNWTYPQSGMTGTIYLISTDTFLIVSQINNGQKINFNNDTTIKITCSLNDTIRIKISPLKDSAKLDVCGNSIKIKLDNKQINLLNESDNKFTLDFKIEVNVRIENTKNNITIDTTKNIYYDAFILATGDDSMKIIIFKKYNIDSASEVSNFLKTIRDKSFSSQKNNVRAAIQFLKDNSKEGLIKVGSNTFSSQLGLDITSLADGLAKFLVARVKKEMAIALFDDLSTRIRSDKTKDLQKLFKNTYEIFDLMGDRIYDFQPYISSIRQNMENDFQNLPISFKALINDSTSQLYSLFLKEKNVLYLAGNSLDFGLTIKENNHVGKALAIHDFGNYQTNADTSVIGAFKSLQLFSESLRDSFSIDTMPYWLDKSKVNKLFSKDTFLSCFIGLITEQAKAKQIYIRPGLLLYNYLNDSIGPAKVAQLHGLLKSLQNNMTQIQQVIKMDKVPVSDDEKKLNVVNYFDAAFDLFETSKLFINLVNQSKNQFDTLYDIASNINDLIKYVSTKKYTLSAMQLAKIMEHFRSSQSRLINTIRFVIDKSIFLGQLAEARTSDDVKEVIESFAAPVGSWRDKRMAKMNIALDSYVGPGYIQSISKKNTAVADVSHFTVSTPVGISTTFMLSKGKTPFTLMLSAIDIGPLAAKRFADDTASIGKIYLKEILAPGIHASIGIGKKTPISVNVGYQQFPLLKKIGEVDLFHKTGLSASINVNIPILTLKNEKISKVTRS